MSNQKIMIIDTSLGNINSISKCVQFLSFDFEIANDPRQLDENCKIIFPGVGSFNYAMQILETKGWIKSLKYNVIEKKKLFLGICLGMQLMASKGFENDIECKGLDFISAEVLNLKDLGCKNKVPHTGWNGINLKKKHKIFSEISADSDFYFNHSYALVPKNKNIILSSTTHEIEFVSIVNYGNIYGMQFHPEKSGDAGKKLLNNFLSI